MSEWFRHYSAARHDPKIRSLRPPLRCVLYHIWAMVAASNGEPFTIEALAIDASLTRAWAAKAISELIERRLLDEREKGLFVPHNWLKRQYKSDFSTERVRRFRKRKRNVSETVHETHQIQSTEVEKGNIPLGNISRSLPAERVTRNAAEAAASGGSLEGSPPAAAAEAERPAPPSEEDRARVAAALENFRRGCVLPNGQDDAPVH